MIKKILFSCLLLLNSAIVLAHTQSTLPTNKQFDKIAEQYVKLVLEIGLYHPAYVDAYYGPEHWRPNNNIKQQTFPAQMLTQRANQLIAQLNQLNQSLKSKQLIQRYQFLIKQLESVPHFIAKVNGKRFNFDQEAKLLYDAQPPHYNAAHFNKIIQQLDSLIPGTAPLYQRVEQFQQAFLIPEDKFDLVLRTAIAEARKRTKTFITLPEDENFTIEYVQDKAWSAYNWYQGKHQSLIQINTQLPNFIDGAVIFAVHEGYPGHHVFNVLQETHLVEAKKWYEYSIYPLYSPISLLSEGSADAAIAMVFPDEEWEAFNRDVLFPMAGIDPNSAKKYHQVKRLLSQLSYSRNEAARLLMANDSNEQAALDWMKNYSLNSPVRMKHNLRFIKTNGSYVINYNFGADIVTEYIKRQAGDQASQNKQKQIFKQLLSAPKTASYMQ